MQFLWNVSSFEGIIILTELNPLTKKIGKTQFKISSILHIQIGLFPCVRGGLLFPSVDHIDTLFEARGSTLQVKIANSKPTKRLNKM